MESQYTINYSAVRIERLHFYILHLVTAKVAQIKRYIKRGKPSVQDRFFADFSADLSHHQKVSRQLSVTDSQISKERKREKERR